MRIWGTMCFLLLVLVACKVNTTDKVVNKIATTNAEDFEDENKAAVQLNDSFDLKLWAPGSLLSNAVAISFDPNGVAYVAETQRRKTSDLDIRAHRDWMLEDLALQTLEDTEQFHLRKLATERSDTNRWMEDFNQDGKRDYRDLEVQSEYIRRIWDGDQDGRADSSSLYAEGFNTMLTGVGAGVLYHNNEVFYTAAPNVYRLKDMDQDGSADERAVISRGFGIHIAYAGHDMSGLTVGPDGKIYWAIGDLGANVVDQTGKRWAYPNEGVVVRANPDGSDFEVFAHGLRNTQELAFDDYGNLISVDNDGDHPGEHERFVHIIEGMDAGWRINWQFGKYGEKNESYKVWMDEGLHLPYFPGQAAYIVPPLALAPNGPAGLAYNPGTALNDQWRGYFFASYFKGSSARSQIQAFKLKPKGASFELADTVSVLSGIASTGCTFGPDGALYINDWLDGYAKKPRGRIWKIDVPQKQQEQRLRTQQLIQEGTQAKSKEELAELLAYPDQRIRLAAQFELVERNDAETLEQVVRIRKSDLARIHAIWGLGQLARKNDEIAVQLLPFLRDEDENIRAQAAKVLGDARYEPALAQLTDLLQDNSAKVQFFAAQALGKLENAKPFDSMVAILERIEDQDLALRHAVVNALSKMPVEEELVNLRTHPSMFVRLATVVVLRQKRSPGLAVFLEDRDPLVVVEAARAIHDDTSVPEALPALARSLERTDIDNEAFLRRAINANLRIGDEASAQRLIVFAANPKVSQAMRKDALWALGYWANPPVLDRVEGRYRLLPARDVQLAYQAVGPYVFDLLENSLPEIRTAVATLIGRLDYQEAMPDLYAILENRNEPSALRIAALESLVRSKDKRINGALDLALSSPLPDIRQSAQDLLASIDLPAAQKVQMTSKILDNGNIDEKQRAIANLATLKDEEADRILSGWMDSLLEDEIEPELKLDVLMAVEKSGAVELKEKKLAYETSLDSTNKLELYQETLWGGNVEKGRRLFYRDQSAQCVRCHQVDGEGGLVGPNLSNIAGKLSREQLLESMINPDARIAPGYGTVLLELKDGRSLAGIAISEKEDAIRLKVGEEVQELAMGEVKTKEYLASGMPSMDGMLSKSQIRDLVAYLVSLKKNPL